MSDPASGYTDADYVSIASTFDTLVDPTDTKAFGSPTDIDGNGQVDALTDAVLILRYLSGLRGPSLVAGAIGPGATRTTAPDIEAYIQTLMP